jgi:hypothetical protein
MPFGAPRSPSSRSARSEVDVRYGHPIDAAFFARRVDVTVAVRGALPMRGTICRRLVRRVRRPARRGRRPLWRRSWSALRRRRALARAITDAGRGNGRLRAQALRRRTGRIGTRAARGRCGGALRRNIVLHETPAHRVTGRRGEDRFSRPARQPRGDRRLAATARVTLLHGGSRWLRRRRRRVAPIDSPGDALVSRAYLAANLDPRRARGMVEANAFSGCAVTATLRGLRPDH